MGEEEKKEDSKEGLIGKVFGREEDIYVTEYGIMEEDTIPICLFGGFGLEVAF